MLVLNWCWISVCYHHKNWFLIVESVGSAYTENATITQGGENYYTCVTQKVSIQKTFKQTKMDLNLSAIIPPDETDEQRKKRVYARPPERFIIDQFNIGDRLVLSHQTQQPSPKVELLLRLNVMNSVF